MEKKKFSYVHFVSPSNTELVIGEIDGLVWNVSSRMHIARFDKWRGWSWDGKTASYIAEMGSDTFLFIRPFNGVTLGALTKQIQVSHNDNWLAWSWYDRVSSYAANVDASPLMIFIRGFNGSTFEDGYQEINFNAENPNTNLRGLDIRAI